MKIMKYYGCYDALEGQHCVVIGEFKSTHQIANWEEYSLEDSVFLQHEVKYRVLFEDGRAVNVYGKNLRRNNTQPPQDLIDRLEKAAEGGEQRPRRVYPYVNVKLVEDHHGKTYSFLNPYTELRELDIVVVQCRGTYKTAKVWGVWSEGEQPDNFKASYAMVEHRVDEERMNTITKQRRKRKEVEVLVESRFRFLRDSLTMDDFNHDPDLCHLRRELNNLED